MALNPVRGNSLVSFFSKYFMAVKQLITYYNILHLRGNQIGDDLGNETNDKSLTFDLFIVCYFCHISRPERYFLLPE